MNEVMKLIDWSRATVAQLRELIVAQQQQLSEYAVRLSELEELVRSGEDWGTDREAAGLSSRGAFLRNAAAGAAGLAGASALGLGHADRAIAAPVRQGIVGSWIVSIDYHSRQERTRGLATVFPDGGFVGSVSAYEHAPLHATPSRGTALHGSWVAAGQDQVRIDAVRLHLSGKGMLLGVMTTQINAELRTSHAWTGTFKYSAARPDGKVFTQGGGALEASRIMPPS
jgi:hypothetical protein